MQRFIIGPPVRNDFILSIFTKWNSFMLWWAKRYAAKKAIELNKTMYCSQMFGSILVYSSWEKRDINSQMSEGKRMNHAQVLKWCVFLISPESAKRDKAARRSKRWPRKKIT